MSVRETIAVVVPWLIPIGMAYFVFKNKGEVFHQLNKAQQIFTATVSGLYIVGMIGLVIAWIYMSVTGSGLMGPSMMSSSKEPLGSSERLRPVSSASRM